MFNQLRKGSIDFTAIIYLIVVVPFLLTILILISQTFRENQCADYITKIGTLESKIKSIEIENQQFREHLNMSEERYLELIRTNVTKKDINDIIYQINQTNNYIMNLEKEINIINNNLVQSYNTLIQNQITSITITFAVVFLFSIDLISFAIFKVDIKKIMIKSIKTIIIKIKNHVSISQEH